MLAACATSPGNRPRAIVDPVIETRIESRTVCPPEVAAALPAEPVMPANAAIEASEAVLAWIGARFRREELLDQRLADARKACPND